MGFKPSFPRAPAGVAEEITSVKNEAKVVANPVLFQEGPLFLMRTYRTMMLLLLGNVSFCINPTRSA